VVSRERVRELLVAEVMTRSVAVVAPDATTASARRVARGNGAHHLLVMDEGILVGILCLCDLHGAGPAVPVSERMTDRVAVTRPDSTLAEAIAIMKARRVGCLPVVAGGLIMGMLSADRLRRAEVGLRNAAPACRCSRRRVESRPS
jgi:acetoin utilization protein AcuB